MVQALTTVLIITLTLTAVHSTRGNYYIHGHYITYHFLCMNINPCSIFHTVDLAESPPASQDVDTAGFCLTLPGQTLYLTPLLALKKFRKRGNKDGAIRAFYRLQEEGLGKVLEIGGNKGTSSVSVCMFYPLTHMNVHNFFEAW